MLTFLSPLFLIGLASAVIPLVIHLTRSRRTRRMAFSTTRFFTDQFLRSYRMSQVKELLLLALRMALCAFFALALARPLLRPPGRALMAGQSRSVVLVLDDSASMAYRDNGGTLFDRARDSARRVLDSLAAGDTASLILAARRAAGAQAVFTQPTPELGDVRQAVERLAATNLGTDLTAAVRAARQQLGSSHADSKEIYLFSDMQATGWDLASGAQTDPEDDSLLFAVSVRPDTVENVGVTAVQYASARPMLGVPFAIRAALRNDGPTPRSVTARLYMDGDKDPVGERKVNIDANRWQIVRFHHSFTKGGWHAGRVAIEPDNLAADNARYFAFEVQDAIRVLAVDGAPSSLPRSDELFFFRTALTVSPEGESTVRVDAISPSGLASADLAAYPLVVLANVEAPSPGDAEKLEQYVDRGGNLLVFLGDRVNPDAYNRLLAGRSHMHGGLLPATLGARVGNSAAAGRAPAPDASSNEVGYVAAVDYNHPALATFEDPKFGNLATVSFRAFYRLEPTEGAAVLMRVTAGGAGAPLLLEKPFGQGRVVLFASTADRDWTDFPLKSIYLPWVYRLTSYLAQERLSQVPFTRTGARVPIPFSAAQGLPDLAVRKPDGTIGHAVLGSDARSPLEFLDTSEPGVYAVTERGRDQPPRLFVANLDGDESRFEPIAGDDVKSVLTGDARIAFVSDPTRVTEASLAARRGLRLWDVLLSMALLFALAEPWLANRISMKHYGRREQTSSARVSDPAGHLTADRVRRGSPTPPAI